VSDIILKGQGDSGKKKAEKLGIKDVESYTREESNVGIKKYVAVIKEYQRKYKTEVETPSTSTFMSLNTALKAFLTVDKVNKELVRQLQRHKIDVVFISSGEIFQNFVALYQDYIR